MALRQIAFEPLPVTLTVEQQQQIERSWQEWTTRRHTIQAQRDKNAADKRARAASK